LLAAARRGTEVLLVAGATDGSLLDQVAALRGRVVPALPLGRPQALTSLFAGSTLEVDLPVPGMHGAARAAIRERIAAISLDSRRLVEVDPRPAFEEAGLDFETADLDALGAAAAGVLAGRLAAANRRWRDAD